MSALLLGLLAALCWGLHDFCVRYVSQRASILQAIFVVFATGGAVICALALLTGGWTALSGLAILWAAASGLAFAVAHYTLYRAFEIGPVKIVAPLIGAFPIASLALAALAGREIAAWQWGAVGVVVLGVSAVAWFSKSDEDQGFHPRAVPWGIAAALSFAGTIALGQEAVRGAEGADGPALAVTRLVAVLAIGAALWRKPAPGPISGRVLPILMAMGVLDAAALGLVMWSGALPHPEFAAVTTSLFGLITVVLAWALLREPMTRPQWLAVAVTFAGVAVLGL